MRRILVCLLVLTMLLTVNVYGQVSQSAVPFLLIAPGARAGGMGETFVSIADDATATHWNPAGLGKYPLSSDWIELTTGKDQQIQKIALVKNDLPNINYKQYDVWAIINGRLAKYEDGEWKTKIVQRLDTGRSLKSIILRYTGLDEDQIKPYYDKLIQLNTDFPVERIDSLQQLLLPNIPDDYQFREEISTGFENIRTAWGDLKINSGEFYKFENMLKNIVADGDVTGSELDPVAFAFERVVSKRAIEKIEIPFDMVLGSPVNCLESHAGKLYVGTDEGLYMYNPGRNRWKHYGAEANLLSLKITALTKYRRKSIIIGTDRELVYFDGVKIKNYPEEKNAPTGYMTSIATASDRKIWAAANDDLYQYDNNIWKNYQVHEVTIGEDLDGIIESFYRSIAIIDKEYLVDQVKNINNIDGELAVGQKLHLPYRFAFRGKLQSLAAKDEMLWVGTSMGTVMFDGTAFFHFGYKEYETGTAKTTEDIAREFLPDPTPGKIEQLSKMIKYYNRLQSDTVEAGKKLMVYANALGSPIHAIACPSSNKAYVGTSYGVIEFSDWQWSRFTHLEQTKTPVHSIKAESGEMWFATDDKVYILSKALMQLSFMHSNYLKELDPDIYFEFFSIIYPTSEWGTFGIGITYLSMGSMQRMSETGVYEGDFHPYDLAFTFSYGSKLLNNLSAGLSARYINSHLSEAGAGMEKGEGTGYSFAMDGGIIYDADKRTTLAATVTNIGPEMSYIDADQADPLPRKLALAFAYKIIDSPFNKLTILGELDKLLIDLNDDLSTEMEEIIPHVGLEYWYSNYVSLRTGYVYDKIGVQRYLTLGASMQWTKYRFDFSYVPSTEDANSKWAGRMENTMRFSMNVGF